MKELNAGLMDDTAYDWAGVAPAPLSMLTMWASGGGNEYELHASRNGPQVQPSLRCHSAPARTLAPLHGDQPPASAERERRPGEVALPRRQLKNPNTARRGKARIIRAFLPAAVTGTAS